MKEGLIKIRKTLTHFDGKVHSTAYYVNETLYSVCLARFWQWGCYRGDFWERVPEASPVLDRANASWVQVGSAAGQGLAYQE